VLPTASANRLRCANARLDPLPDLLWGEGQPTQAKAGGLKDGVGNGGSDAVGGDFPHSFGAKGSIGICLLHQVNFDEGNFLGGGDAVVAEASVEDLALFISDQF
jgi:hypothetical protein